MAERHPFSDISWKVSEPEYRADPALSYSTLQRYEREGGFRSIPTLAEEISSPALTFGNLVDALVTGGYADFDSVYYVADLPELSEALQNIARVLFERFGTEKSFDELLDDQLSEIGKECEYYAGDKYAAYRAKLIRENCREYYNVLSSATGKTLISQKDYDDAVACKDAFLSSPYTQHYFSTNENQELYFQLKFKGEDPSNHMPYRCMMDMVKVDFAEKKVYPFDIKTTSKPEEEFYKSYLQFLYNLQSRNYWRLLRQNMDKDPYYREFKLMDYTFLVVNRVTLSPLAWEDSKTQTIGDVVYETANNRKIVIRDPWVIGAELTWYRANSPQYPIGVGVKNSITRYIEENM